MKCSEVRELAPQYPDSKNLDVEIQSHLAECPSCARMVSDIWNLDQRVKAAILAEDFDTVAFNSRVMQQIAPKPAARRRNLWPWGLAAAAAVILSVFVAQPAPKLSVLSIDAAEDHRDEVVNHQRRRWTTDAVSLAKLTETHHVPVTLVDALGKAGFTFKHARTCTLDGLLYVHLVYSDSSGKEFSVFLRNEDGGKISGSVHRSWTGGKAVYTSDTRNQHVAGFTNGNLKALVVTNESDEAALRIAKAASQFI